MDYRVEELAAAAGVRVDTVRFYQGRGLIEKPRRQGRAAIYDDRHLTRLRRIRALLEQGFSLAQIRRVVLLAERDAQDEPLLEALVSEEIRGDRTITRTFTRSELAAEAGVPEALIQAAQAAALVEPIRVGDEDRFTFADLEMARAALVILGAGFPLDALLQIAVSHARNIQEVADSAIDLFDDHIRKADVDEEAVTDAFRRLLPQITRLVALHFQRTLINRAVERLGGRGETHALQQALGATQSGRLEVEWR